MGLRRAVVALVLPLACSSCFTALVWAMDDFHAEDVQHDAETARARGEDVPDGAENVDAVTTVAIVAAQVVLTPAAIVLDIVTLPVQLLWWFPMVDKV